MVKRISKKIWYLKCRYSKTELRDILERTNTLLFNIRMTDDVSVKSSKKLNKIENILLELQMIDIEDDD